MASKQSHLKAWKNIEYKGFFYTSLIISIVLGLTIVVVKSHLPPVVPFFYGRPQGDNQLISSLGLLTAPILTMGIVLLNAFLSLFIENLFIKKILAVCTLLFSILLAITVVKIIFLVGFF